MGRGLLEKRNKMLGKGFWKDMTVNSVKVDKAG